jgi:excisionase family DNA binding protein
LPEGFVSSREAALALGVSVDTVRRMKRDGRIVAVRDARNWRLVPVSEIEPLSGRPVRKFYVTAAITRDSVQELGLAPRSAGGDR